MGIFERGPNDPGRKELNPVLKLALELGPLAVFFFGNAYGDSAGAGLSRRSRALGGRLFVGDRALHRRDARRARRLVRADAAAADHAVRHAASSC